MALGVGRPKFGKKVLVLLGKEKKMFCLENKNFANFVGSLQNICYAFY